jgi:quinol monooxygenase YgiN
MGQITTDRHIATLINVFTVEPDRQQPLVDALSRATDETIRHLPGFISANIHKSLDGTRVTNYAQWRSREDLEAMLNSGAAQPHLAQAKALATSFEPHLYEVSSVHDAGGTRALSATAAALGAVAFGAFAVGALAIGALAVGRVAVGSLSLGHGTANTVAIGRVDIDQLRVRELLVERGPAVM